MAVADGDAESPQGLANSQPRNPVKARDTMPTPDTTTAATDWHARPAEAVLETLDAAPEGLSPSQARARLEQHGPNLLPRPQGDTVWTLLWRQINSPLIWVLLVASLVALVADPHDGVKNGLVILAVVILNTAIGFFQEYRAGKAIEALSGMVPEFATALRDGQRLSVPVADLVPGDVVLLASGDKVPADLRLLQSRTLQIEEAALTGESVPVDKASDPVDSEAALGDRRCMAFAGTLVTYGTGTGVVAATGGKTELGRISTMLSETTDLETPLTRALQEIGAKLTVGIVVLSALMLAVGTAREMNNGVAFFEAFRGTITFAIALAVGAIPEGLPAVVTIALAIGVQRMAARRAVIRKLPAVETLGSTTVICSDKTGTLTRNEMTVQALWTPEAGPVAVEGVGYEPSGGFSRPPGSPEEALLRAGALCNDASLHEELGRWVLTGDPTEGALLTAAEKAGLRVEDLRREWARLDAIPFESQNQFMATLHRTDQGTMLLLKGAPEVILSRCAGVPADQVHREVEALASQGMRVLAFAEKELPRGQEEVHLEDAASGFRFLGLQGMIDPPRTEAIEAIRACHTAGITVKMITGDHQATAEAIGRQLGLQAQAPAVTGRQIAAMDDASLAEALRRSNVFARVAPEHKLRLVRSLQAQGEVAAMTGDGVNDAPALKQADIGVAMGITGTAVSKESADLVLTDDNFASIRAAVEEGRRVYDNLVKSLAFVLPTNLGLAFILTWGVAFFPFHPQSGELLLPMLPAQLLWVNLIASFFLGTPLAFEAPEKDLMSRPPRRPGEPILSPFVLYRTVMVALLMTAGALVMFQHEYASALASGLGDAAATAEAQTMAVTTVVAFQVFYLLNCRSMKDSVLAIGLWSNPMIYVGIGLLAVLQLLFIYLPVMNTVFGTLPLSALDLGKAIMVGAVVLPVVAVEKSLRARRAPAAKA